MTYTLHLVPGLPDCLRYSQGEHSLTALTGDVIVEVANHHLCRTNDPRPLWTIVDRPRLAYVNGRKV